MMLLEKLLMLLVISTGSLGRLLGVMDKLFLVLLMELGILLSSSLSVFAPCLFRESAALSCSKHKLTYRWNFPAAMIARKVAPVIATGCTAVIKVPSETPYTNLAIMEVCPCTKLKADPSSPKEQVSPTES
jgi:hypothetical protein